jgi:predicted RNA polymerase sigma factor
VRVLVNFQHRKGWNIHTMAEDCRTRLGPYRDVASEATMLRLFRHLGASEDAMQEAERDLRRWSRGGIHIDVPEDRLYLLGVVQRPIDLERRR